MIEIYTDGSFRPPRFGAYGWIIVEDDVILNECVVGVEDTTNNRMELSAILESLKVLQDRKGETICVYTDSQYCFLSLTKWCFVWKKNKWMTQGQESVKNRDILEPLFNIVKTLKVKVNWIRGHNGNPYNERIDKLVQKETESMIAFTKLLKK